MPPACEFLVAPTGFEPATSALRGRRPKPLDDGATCQRCALQCTVKMAGVEGVEPSHTVPETAVLPLDDTPSDHRCSSPLSRRGASASEYITGFAPLRQPFAMNFSEKVSGCARGMRRRAEVRRWHAARQLRSPWAADAPRFQVRRGRAFGDGADSHPSSNPISTCAASQKGLLREAPQRQSA